MATVFTNDMTAHVWAQFTQESGRSNNGNLYFDGRALFSYGRHFVAGFLAPEPGNPQGVGVAFINSDSYSISTSRHVSLAAGAVRHRGRVWVPNLTKLADIFADANNATRERLNPGCYPTEYGAASASAFARYMGPRLARHFANPANLPTDGRNGRAERIAHDAESVVSEVFRAASCDAPERRARAAVNKARTAAKRAEAERAARDKADSLRALARFARTNPADVTQRMESDARERVRQWERARDSWADTGRDVFRAIKTGKASGRVAQVRKASAVRAAIRAGLPLFELAATRAARLATWRNRVAELRVGIGAAVAFRAGSESVVRVTGGSRPGVAYDVGRAIARAGELADALTDAGAWAAGPCRITGGNPDELATRLRALAGELAGVESDMERAERRAAVRRDVVAIRDALSTAPDAPAGERAESAQNVVRIAGQYMNRDAIGTYRPGPWKAIPGVWRVAGWTPERFRALHDGAATVEKAARAELRELAERETVAARAEALRIWRAGGRVPSELARHTPRALPDGSAYVRAVGVVRDDSGAIVGGNLETSQGATVPLAHAIRVFQFLRACRDAGKAWRTNGRTLRVGQFRVDSVESCGSFRAGCHKFAWQEIAHVAAELGLESIAPADTTESHAHA